MTPGISILHVDDEPELADLAATYLERHDERFSVSTATGVSEALDRLTAETDCLISDYDMPTMNGIELLKRVRADYPELPVILFTGKGSEEVASEAISAGVTDYLQKETNVEQYAVLANRVANAVEQRRAKARIDAERQRFRVLFERLTQPAVEIGYDDGDEAVVNAVNPAFEEVFGYGNDDLVGESPDAYIVPEDDRAEAAEISEQFRVDGEVGPREVTRRTEQGPREFLLQTAALDDRPGGFAIYTDITARKQRERKLQALHAVAGDLAESESVEAVCDRTVAASEEILSFDLSVVSIRDGDVIEPMAISQEVPPDGLGAMSISEGIVGKTFRTKQSFRFSDISSVPDANPQGPYASAISVPIGDHGTFQAVAKTADAFSETDLELAELLLRHTESALDRLAHERELEHRNEQLDHFASVISHDLRNPLNVATGRVDLLREECASPHLDHVERAHDRMQELIENLLSLTSSAGGLESVASLSLARLAERSWRTVDTGDATLEVADDRVLTGDDSRLRQLFENLVRNAVEHSDAPVTVTVGTAPGGFYVEDDGPGIPASDREAVFEPGYSTTTEGTGLGLAIVYNIVQAHGWEVDVTASPSGGARFEFTGVERGDEAGARDRSGA